MSGKTNIKFPRNGIITLEQREQISSYLQSKAPFPGKCPTCRQNNWTFLEHFVALPVFYPYGYSDNENIVYPCIATTCESCGNTQLINAGRVLDQNKVESESGGGND